MSKSKRSIRSIFIAILTVIVFGIGCADSTSSAAGKSSSRSSVKYDKFIHNVRKAEYSSNYESLVTKTKSYKDLFEDYDFFIDHQWVSDTDEDGRVYVYFRGEFNPAEYFEYDVDRDHGYPTMVNDLEHHFIQTMKWNSINDETKAQFETDYRNSGRYFRGEYNLDDPSFEELFQWAIRILRFEPDEISIDTFDIEELYLASKKQTSPYTYLWEPLLKKDLDGYISGFRSFMYKNLYVADPEKSGAVHEAVFRYSLDQSEFEFLESSTYAELAHNVGGGPYRVQIKYNQDLRDQFLKNRKSTFYMNY